MFRQNIHLLAGLIAWTLTAAPVCYCDHYSPIVDLDKVGHGSFVRLLSESERILYPQGGAESAYTYSVDFVRGPQIGRITEYKLEVEFLDRSQNNGNATRTLTHFRTFTDADFVTMETGFRGMLDIDLCVKDLMDTLDLKLHDLSVRDLFIIEGTITTQDGAIFTSGNTTTTIKANLGGHFDFALELK